MSTISQDIQRSLDALCEAKRLLEGVDTVCRADPGIGIETKRCELRRHHSGPHLAYTRAGMRRVEWEDVKWSERLDPPTDEPHRGIWWGSRR